MKYSKLVRRIGKGFPDFKLRLAGELARREFRIAQDISPDDSCSGVMAKVFDAAHATLHTTLQQLDAAVVDTAAGTLGQARSITIHAVSVQEITGAT